MKKFLTMALALMMVLSLFAVPTMAADGHYLGEDLLGGKGTFEALDPDSYIAANGTDGFAAYDATITAQVVEEAGNKYVTLTPSNDTRAPGLYITRVEEVGEGSGNYLMPVTEGQRYAISFDAWYQGTLTNASWNTTINADTYFFDANGTQVKRYYYGFNSAIFASGIWGSYDYEIVAPAGAAYMRVQLALPKACGVFKLDNISVKTTDELVSSALQYGAPYGSFETFSTNDSQWVATGGYAMWHLNTAGSAVYKNTSTSDIFRLFANGDNLLDNTDENNGIMAQDGQMYVGIQGDPNATLWNAENVEATDGRVFFNLALDYDTTYEISVWFNAANAKDSYGEDELPLTPVLTINGEKAATRGQVRQAFTEAWKVDGWQKLTWEVTTPTAEWYTTQTGSGAATSAATVGFGCYGTEMGYFDNFSVVEKKAAPQPPVVEPTEYDVTITAGANANASVSAATSEGEAVNFTVAPKFGYYIQSITIGGTPFTGFNAYKGGTYSTGAIEADTEIVVTVAELSANTEDGVSTAVATLPAVFAETGEAPVTFGKVLADVATVDEFGIYLTTAEGDEVESAVTKMGPHFKAFRNINGQYAIEFQGLAAGEYIAKTYVKVAGVTTYGIATTFTVE